MSTDRKKRYLGLATLAICASLAQTAAGEDFVNTGYFGNVAIKGYDPVAYFNQNKAVEGSPNFTYRWLGATWQFTSAENRDLFAKEPTRYAPQYGGYCADGVSLGTVTTNIDPKAWRIIDGKLYISYDPGAAEGFEKNPSKLPDSKEHWSEVEQTLVTEKAGTDWRHAPR
jgi:hypothetical protein